MATNFSQIAFTPSVRKQQVVYGTRDQMKMYDTADEGAVQLTENESAFIALMDGFYMASVGDEGWPYVQFRGGPKGFLKVLGDQTLAYADFRGNLQLVSVGNIANNQRVALILMDYTHRTRLKIYAEATVIPAEENPELRDKVSMPGYNGKVERIIRLKIKAFDWNCPRHIPVRYSKEDVAQLTQSLNDEIFQLKQTINKLQREQS
jgi:predicted pyridoxine 5'-phosphate oxidase superfamily flavin-nucleotide-binding protein